ncbi:MAG: hypothetical protein IJR54_01625, partial [Oscillibacter sp.]|nr:hypothetical protein [Oscillibacter sp.]
VAIIAILVAIGIPAFSTAMERSREAVDLANMRAAYAEFMAGTLGDDYNTGTIQIKFKQTKEGWTTDVSGLLSLVNDPDNVLGDSGPHTTSDQFIQFAWKEQAANNESSKPTISLVGEVPTVATGEKSTGDGTSTMKFTKTTTTTTPTEPVTPP